MLLTGKEIKRMVAERAFQPFTSGVTIRGLENGYHIVMRNPTNLLISIKTNHGPRFFEISVKERM